jgi:crotonobetaine/carnitine-CoA ligase
MGTGDDSRNEVGGVAGVLARRATRRPDDELVKCGGDWVTGAELQDAASRVAMGLAALGVERGARVAFIAPNRPEVLELVFAVARLGAIQVPLNYFLKGAFLRHQLAQSGASVLVCDRPGFEAALPLLGETAVEHVVLLDGLGPDAPTELTEYAELRVSASDGAPAPKIEARDPFAIIYTSGTTGMPKGCVLPHGSFVASTRAFREAGWIVDGDRIFTAFPLFHTSGQIISLMNALVVGDSVCFEPEFSASNFVERAAQEQATVLQGVGPMAMAILARPDLPSDKDHNLRLASFIPMDPSSQDALATKLGTPVTAAAYGQTEANPVTMGRLGAPVAQGSAGQPSSNFEVRLVDDDDDEVPVGEVGEVTVRPGEPWSMFSGYWNDFEATLEAFRNLWHHTGDYGRMDEDGFLFFVDRKKDALRRRGENISSFELEAAIVQHPAIAQVAVVAESSPLGEDDVRACMVLVPGSSVEPTDLFEYFQAALPYFAIPRYVDIRDALPVNAMGRVMKHVLRDEGVTATMWDFEQMGLVVAKAYRR